MIAEVDAVMEAEIKPDGPGAAVAVIQDGMVTHARGYGLANLEWRIPVQPDTVFRLASITKQFTAAAIMMLAEQGKLSVDDPITKFVPDYPTSGHHITVHHLLTHTSGIFSYTNDPDALTKLQRDMSPQDIMKEFWRVPFDFKPGARYQYNNSAYFLLGIIIEKVSGMGYAEFLQKSIFDPLGMKDTFYLSNEPIVPRRASGYDDGSNGIQNARYLSMTQPYAAGALGSTVNDLALWNKALTENRLLTAETLARMHTTAMLDDGVPIDYGYGWSTGAYHGHRTISHGGGIFGFSTYMARFPDDNLCVIVLTNYFGFDPEKLTAMIARRIFGLPEVKRKPYGLGMEALKKCAGSYRLEGFPLQIVVEDDGKMMLSYGRTLRLMPMSRTEFYAPDNPEMLATFSDEQDGVFTSLTLAFPFNTKTARRIPENQKG